MITGKQKKILEFVEEFFAKNNFPPTLSDIAKEFSFDSRNTAYYHITRLIASNLLARTETGRISLPVSDSPAGIPFLGYIAAGRPIEAVALGETIDIAEKIAGKNCFALRVKGDSMIDDHIMEGDIIIVERSETAREGQTVVALIDNYEATLKKLSYTNDKKVKLVPANEKYKPILLEPSQVKIQGILKLVIRSS